MTHQSHQTNGASLEDCHTNFYALTDLCGIKWRKLVSNDRPNATSDPLDDPVLRSYSRCLVADILCVWRRVIGIKNDSIYDIPSNVVHHPPLSLTAAKELWIFWYGEEPDLTELVVPELLKANEGTTDHGSWENGLSYEGRGLLFKALHNLIERSLLSRDVVLRLGRWFVQPCNDTDDMSQAAMSASSPGSIGATGSSFLAQSATAAAANASNCNERVFGKSNHNLSFSFAFFVHGDSTVCASIDLREHPAVRRLTLDHIQQAAAASAAATTNQQSSPPPPPFPLKAQTPLASPATGGPGSSNGVGLGESVPKPQRVILAPFGMSGTLTGQVYRLGSLDVATQKALDDWCAFYPLTVTADHPGELPVMVEVVTGGVKMRYPTKYVLVSDIDEFEAMTENEDEQATMPTGNDVRFAASIKVEDGSEQQQPSRGSNNHNMNSSIISSSKDLDLRLLQQPNKSGFTEALGNDLGHPLSMHLRPTVATILPERVWQDCVLNPLHVGVLGMAKEGGEKAAIAGTPGSAGSTTAALPMVSPSQIKQEPMDTSSTTTTTTGASSRVAAETSTCSTGGGQQNAVFKFIDPSQKSSCSCTKCKRGTGRGGGSSSSGSTSSSSNSSSSGGPIPISNSNSSNSSGGGNNNNSGGGGSGKSSSYRSEKSNRPSRIPFHKRRLTLPLSGLLARSQHQHHQNSNSNRHNHGGANKSRQDISAKAAGFSSSSSSNTTSRPPMFNVSQRTNKSSSCGGSGNKQQSANSSGSAANDSLVPMTSCGNSPGSAEPSPHGNATGLSQQSLPSELLSMASPSVDQQQQQPPTTVMEKLLNSENNSTSNLNSQGVANKSSSLLAQTEDRLVVGAHQFSTEPGCSSTTATSSNNSSNPFKGNSAGCSSSKRKMDFGSSSFNPNSANCSGISSVSGNNSNGSGSFATQLLKRPTLMSHDYENIIDDDDAAPNQLLYDYSSCDAWFNIAVKRCKVTEENSLKAAALSKQSFGYRDNELYALHQRQLQLRKEQQLQQLKNLSVSAAALSSSTGILLGPSSQTATNSPSGNSSTLTAANAEGGAVGNSASASAGGDGVFGIMSPQEMLLDFQAESPHDSKTGISTAEDEGGGSSAIGESKSLLTSKGLQPSYNDLENLFDDNLMIGCDDNSNDFQVNTPPASNNSVSGTGSSVTSVSVMNSNLGSLAGGSSAELLTKMYPTPPSLENHPNSSPCGGALSDGGGGGLLSSDIDMKVTVPQEPVNNVLPYPNLGSPMEEPIEDWSYVFMPEKRCSLVGSSKYAPMTDLPSQALPPIQMSVNSVYEATWERKPKVLPPPMKQQVKPMMGPVPVNNNKENISQNPLMAKSLGGLMNIKQEPQVPGSPMGGGGVAPGCSTSASVTNPMLTAQLSRPSPLQGPMIPGPPSMGVPPMHVPPHLRGMSPMGPQFSPNTMQHPMSQQMPFRRAPLAPPPPYELAVASPANQGPSFSGMVVPGGPGSSGNDMHMQHMQMQRMMMNQQMMGGAPGGFQGATNCGMMGSNFGGGGMMNSVMMGANAMGGMTAPNALPSHGTMVPASSASSTMGSLPEADSLLVNVLLYDTLLNIFRDHNFDSCTICVCNATKKCVGNIRGSDSGVYLALRGHSFAQMTAALGMGNNGGSGDATSGYMDDDPIQCQCGFSAVVNRRLAHKSGLFYEDEMEITGMAVDPTVYKKRSLLSFVLNEMQNLSGAKKKTSDSNNNVSAVIKQEPSFASGGSRSNTPDAGGNTNSSSMLMDVVRNNCDNAEQECLPLAIMELLRDQCTTLVQNSSSSILRAVRRYQNENSSSLLLSQQQGSVTRRRSRTLVSINTLDYTEAHDVVALALQQARLAFESSTGIGGLVPKMELDAFGNPLLGNHQMMRVNNGPLSSTSSIGSGSALMRPSSVLSVAAGGPAAGAAGNKLSTLTKGGAFNVHKWPYVNAKGPRSNQDIIRLMKSMQPILQNALHKDCKTRLWEPTYTVNGPLTWRQFHRLASSSTTDQCEPQPIPSIIVGHERDWLSLSPYALQYWDKLLLEPYSYSRDIAYVVVAPDNDFVVAKVKTFFKELSTTYEMCKLGRHTPIKGWDGVFRVGKTMKHIAGVTNDSSSSSTSTSSSSNVADDWFATLGESKVAESLRLYYQACQSYLVPYFAKVPGDKTLLDPPESYMWPAPPGPYGSNASSAVNLLNKSLPSPMLPPNTPEPSTANDKAPNTPKSSADQEGGDQKDALNSSGGVTLEPLSTVDNDDVNPPCIMIYIVEPFTCGNDSPELQRLACLSLLRCYSNILNSVPDAVRGNISFQIVSQESVCELGRSRSQLRWSDEMRCLALSVFSQCRRFLTHTSNGKSLTGFGTAAQMELFLKNKDEKNRIPYKLYTPPYILSAKQEKVEKAETVSKKGREQPSSVLYCSYCLSKDQNWLLAVVTDERGELLETATINIDIPNRARRKKASARLYGLQKLMDFMLGVISQTVQPWRLVVGRIGRIGHGELKSWSFLLSKANLLKASKHLKEICKQCSLLSPGAVPSILSACLIAMEPDSNLRVMPDQFTPDERFSQMSVQNPLSTPQDVSCTHILVFPLSAKAQSTQTAFNDQNLEILEDDNFLPIIDEEEDDNVNGFSDLFNEWDGHLIQPSSPDRRSRPGTPEMDEIMVTRNSPGMPSSNGGQKAQQDTEEIGTLLQQPLSLGYLVSTAPMVRMPDWFWAACPHMENVCPAYLKTALHLHSPSIHTQDEILQQNNSSSTEHPLDSMYTEVVLRHVMEGCNQLSWLAMDSNTHDRLSCLPIHVQLLMQLYHMSAALT